MTREDGDTGRRRADGSDDAVTRDGDSLLVREGDVAADYLEQLLDIVDYDGDIDLDVENGRAIVAVVGSDLEPIGRARTAQRSTRCRSSPAWPSSSRPASAAG